ncbi:crotonase/enoyl-CoA hydratase family protein [Sphingosinicella sp. BN140058]|uniref:crotonase/enoyl-CoA hydratase family protein n=1 Tax=Sphingosinicella sp. BN140058 TaxID=1892855 RepID=UPI001011EC88|nr:crotonase/enoyl-CoA hydratase family protein [Sphingosinicella sp. BN140058]QAY76681.1 crotonase/enoyl-CoA hydratase family protein [Sphingosinicella sp. BN140058]
MGSERIRVDRQGGVAAVELARGDKMNAMDEAMFTAIGETFRSLGSDATVRAIVLSGEGRHFTAGIDLQYAITQFGHGGDHGRGTERRLRDIQRLQDAFSAIEAARPPVIAAVHGGCIGAGVDLASACDIRLASADAYFAIAEVDVAITADLGTLQRLGHLIPHGIVRELVYTGRRVEAAEAARLGLVNRLCESRDSVLAAALDMARTIAEKSPLAVAGAKMSLNYSRGRTVEDGLRHVAMWNAGALVSADLGVALEARLARSAARFEDLDP